MSDEPTESVKTEGEVLPINRDSIHVLLDQFLDREGDTMFTSFVIERTNQRMAGHEDDHEGGAVFRVAMEQQVAYRTIEAKPEPSKVSVVAPPILGPAGRPMR